MKEIKSEDFSSALRNISMHFVTTKVYINLFEKIVTDREIPLDFDYFFKIVGISLSTSITINLSKVADKREAVNLYKVVETYNKMYSDEQIEVIFDEKALAALKTARDKFFAHNDSICMDENHGPSLQYGYILSISNEIERVLNIIYKKEKNIKLFNNEDTSSDKPTNRIIANYSEIQRLLKQQEDQTNGQA